MQYPLTRHMLARMLDNSFIGTHPRYVKMPPEEVPLGKLNLSPEQLQASESALAADSSLEDRYFSNFSNGYEHPATDLVMDRYCEHVGLL